MQELFHQRLSESVCHIRAGTLLGKSVLFLSFCWLLPTLSWPWLLATGSHWLAEAFSLAPCSILLHQIWSIGGGGQVMKRLRILPAQIQLPLPAHSGLPHSLEDQLPLPCGKCNSMVFGHSGRARPWQISTESIQHTDWQGGRGRKGQCSP